MIDWTEVNRHAYKAANTRTDEVVTPSDCFMRDGLFWHRCVGMPTFWKAQPLTDHARGQLADRLKVPVMFLRDMDARGQRRAADEMINARLRDGPVRILVRSWDKGPKSPEIRAILSDTYRIMDNEELLRTISERAHECEMLRISKSSSGDLDFDIGIATHRASIRKGDVVQAGFRVRNSEVGRASTIVRPSIWRLECKNVMMVPETIAPDVAARHAGGRLQLGPVVDYSNKRIEAEVRTVVDEALEAPWFSSIVERLRVLASIKIDVDGPTEILEKRIEAVLKSDDNMTGEIVRTLLTGGDFTAWGLLNAITATARTVTDDELRYRLEGLGGDLAMTEGKFEEMCQ